MKTRYPEIRKWINEKFMKEFLKHGGSYSQAQFARDAGMSASSMNKIFLGNTMPTIETVILIANAFGTEKDEQSFYSVCGYPELVPKGDLVRRLIRAWLLLNQDERNMFIEDIEQTLARKNKAKE